MLPSLGAMPCPHYHVLRRAFFNESPELKRLAQKRLLRRHAAAQKELGADIAQRGAMLEHEWTLSAKMPAYKSAARSGHCALLSRAFARCRSAASAANAEYRAYDDAAA